MRKLASLLLALSTLPSNLQARPPPFPHHNPKPETYTSSKFKIAVNPSLNLSESFAFFADENFDNYVTLEENSRFQEFFNHLNQATFYVLTAGRSKPVKNKKPSKSPYDYLYFESTFPSIFPTEKEARLVAEQKKQKNPRKKIGYLEVKLMKDEFSDDKPIKERFPSILEITKYHELTPDGLKELTLEEDQQPHRIATTPPLINLCSPNEKGKIYVTQNKREIKAYNLPLDHTLWKIAFNHRGDSHIIHQDIWGDFQVHTVSQDSSQIKKLPVKKLRKTCVGRELEVHCEHGENVGLLPCGTYFLTLPIKDSDKIFLSYSRTNTKSQDYKEILTTGR